MNDPFFSASSRKKLAGSQPPRRNNVKSLKNMKTSTIIKNVQERAARKAVKPSVSMRPLSSSEEESTTPSSSEDENNESSDEMGTSKRLKMAKEYIRSLKSKNSSDSETSDDEVDAAELDKDIISSRLMKRAFLNEGKRFSTIGNYISPALHILPLFNNNKLPGGKALANGPPSALCIHSKTRSIFCATKKSQGVVRWLLSPDFTSIEEVQSYRLNSYPGIQAIDVTSDGIYLVAGGTDSLIHVWDLRSGSYLRALKHHRGPITGLKFRLGSSDLYSISVDHSLKVWQFSSTCEGKGKEEQSLSHIDTLFGHQENPLDLSVLSKERCISVGGRDRSARLWKITDTTHLIFNASHESSSLDLVTMLTESVFVTSSENRELTLWNTSKKRPSFSLKLSEPISALKALPHSALFVSGHSCGLMRIWKAASGFSCFELISLVQVREHGFITDFAWLYPESIFAIANERDSRKAISQLALAVTLSREPRLGRWNVASSLSHASQGTYLFSFSLAKETGLDSDIKSSSESDFCSSVETESDVDSDNDSVVRAENMSKQQILETSNSVGRE